MNVEAGTKRPPFPSPQSLLIILGLLAFFVLTQWNTLNGPFERDEGEYAYAAWIMKGGAAPYQHSFLQKPPMIIYTYWVSQLLSDQAFWPPRLLGTIFLALTAVVVGLIARREYGPRAAWISIWILLPLYALARLLPFAANTEKFMNLPMVGVVALQVCFRHKSAGWVWFLAGVLAATAILYKPICLLVLLFTFSVWTIHSLRSGPGVAGTLARLGCSLAGGLCAVGLALSYFILHGGMKELWESSVLFNISYSNPSSWSPAASLRIMGSVFNQWWLLWALLLWFLIRRPGRWWFHVALLVVSLFSAYKDPNGHYYLMVLPFWAIVGSAALDSLIHTLMSRGWVRSRSLPVTAVLVVVGLLCLPVVHQFSLRPSALYRWTYGPGNPFHESPIVAGRVAALTKPEDDVFIAGSEPQILYYAKRRSPTRFVIMYPLMLPSPFAEGYQREVIKSLQARPPALIVLCNSSLSWLSNPHSPQLLIPFLNRLFETGTYELLGGYLWKDAGDRWLEPVDRQQASQCSLLLFRRKPTG